MAVVHDKSILEPAFKSFVFKRYTFTINDKNHVGKYIGELRKLVLVYARKAHQNEKELIILRKIAATVVLLYMAILWMNDLPKLKLFRASIVALIHPIRSQYFLSYRMTNINETA